MPSLREMDAVARPDIDLQLRHTVGQASPYPGQFKAPPERDAGNSSCMERDRE